MNRPAWFNVFALTDQLGPEFVDDELIGFGSVSMVEDHGGVPGAWCWVGEDRFDLVFGVVVNSLAKKSG